MGGSGQMTSMLDQSWRVRPAYGWSACRPSIVYTKKISEKKNVSNDNSSRVLVVAYDSNNAIGAEYGEV